MNEVESKRLERIRNLLTPLFQLPELLENNNSGQHTKLIDKLIKQSKEVIPMIGNALDPNVSIYDLNQLYFDPSNRIVVYEKELEDQYTYVGITDEDISKYRKVDVFYFGMLIHQKVLAKMFGTKNNSKKFFTYREFLIVQVNGINHKFKFDHEYGIPYIEKINDTQYRFWSGSIKKEDKVENFYVYINVEEDKVIFDDREMETLIAPLPDDSGNLMGRVSVRTLEIQEEIITSIKPSELDQFVKSHNVILTYNL